MGCVVDYLRKAVLVPTPETVNADWSTVAVNLDDRQGSFSLYIKYENGTGVNMKVVVEMSPTNMPGTWAPIEESEQEITDPTGMVYYDFDGSGAEWVRISVIVTSGSIDVTEGHFSAQKAHQ